MLIVALSLHSDVSFFRLLVFISQDLETRRENRAVNKLQAVNRNRKEIYTYPVCSLDSSKIRRRRRRRKRRSTADNKHVFIYLFRL